MSVHLWGYAHLQETEEEQGVQQLGRNERLNIMICTILIIFKQINCDGEVGFSNGLDRNIYLEHFNSFTITSV